MSEVARLDGKVALITGAASGQGRAAAALFAQQGARVVVADVNDDGSKETVSMIEQAGGEAFAVHADVADRADAEAMVTATVEAFGRIDVLYNNAAVQMSGTLLECSEADWDLTFKTNLSAIFWACRAAIPHMIEGDGGSIINTASVLALVGSEGYCAYGAAKAGLVALTRQMAVEYGPKVRANVIAPGSIDTPRFRKVADALDDPEGFIAGLSQIIPLKRLGTATDVASIALFLASDQSAYVSGAVVPADGGLAALR
ncbi:MAG TPA: SDR family NAD(P)-dependent oxidoreductase [Acidimicrobiia bacterium]|nr:SDR family NAD(P)-dependent oxidoreductase [Acidimicrobiia bacterium]